ncbi:hypothetical protein WP50_22280 [Lactiplantibacillus plantarum]|nr:hypothetical protein WP50_22280 [Lactiplantibacillus plantarum]
MGKTGLQLPVVSLGLWRNFGDEAPFANSRKVVLDAFDHGVFSFDLANNYGPSKGSAEPEPANTSVTKVMVDAVQTSHINS